MSEKFLFTLHGTFLLAVGISPSLSLADEETSDPQEPPGIIQLEVLPAQVHTVPDLARTLPGVAWQWRDFSSDSSGIGLSLRGAGAAGGVPVIFAGVRLPVSVSLEDVDTAALMTGAQGVELGAGATVGALLLSPEQPQLGETSGGLQGFVSQQAVGFDGGENHQVTGVLNLPFGERFAARFATGNGKRRGVVDYTGLYEVNRFNEPTLMEPRRRLESAAVIAPSEGPDEAGVDFARLGLLWQPSDQLKSTFFYHAESGLADARSYSAPGLDRVQPEIRIREEAYRDLDLASLDIEWQLQGGMLITRTGWLDTRTESLDDLTALSAIRQQLASEWPRRLVLEERRGAVRSLVQEVAFESSPDESWTYRIGGRYERQQADYESRVSLPGYAQWLQAGGAGAPVALQARSMLPAPLAPDSRELSATATLDWVPAERWQVGIGARLVGSDVRTGLFALEERKPLLQAHAAYETADKAEWFARFAQGYGPGLMARMMNFPGTPEGSTSLMSPDSRVLNLQEWSDSLELGIAQEMSLPGNKQYQFTYTAAFFALRREADFLLVDQSPEPLISRLTDQQEQVLGIDMQAGFVAGPLAVTAGLMLADRDRAGAEFWYAPERVGKLSMEYRRPMFDDLSLVMALSGYFQSGNDSAPEGQETEAYQLWDFGIEVQATDWDLNLFLKNMTNTDAVTGSDNGQVFRLLPRTVGVGLSYRF